MSDSTQPAGGTSPRDELEKNAAASDSATRKRPSLAPMGSSVTAAPMKTRPPMTPLPPLAPKPPPPPEATGAPAKRKGGRGKLGLLLGVMIGAAAAAYFLFLRSP